MKRCPFNPTHERGSANCRALCEPIERAERERWEIPEHFEPIATAGGAIAWGVPTDGE